MCIFQRRQFSAVFFVSVPRRSRTFSPATHTMKPKEHNANGGENMEGLLWLLILCTLTAGALAILGICRRMQEHTLPERIVTWVALSEQAQLQAQLEALAAQVLWADCALLKTVWLVDATPESVCCRICRHFAGHTGDFAAATWRSFRKSWRKLLRRKNKDCISSKKRV